jgi:hypothetical protein
MEVSNSLDRYNLSEGGSPASFNKKMAGLPKDEISVIRFFLLTERGDMQKKQG